MIITRTPLRISLGGGGTDLPSYYREFGGFVLSAAINKYVYITINQTFFPGYLLKYSEMELAESYGSIRHPLIREALRLHEMPARLEIVSIADVPAGTGMARQAASWSDCCTRCMLTNADRWRPKRWLVKRST
jgi:D-glycero-alpha-D-manno-heptose-7-phosphate kinase